MTNDERAIFEVEASRCGWNVTKYPSGMYVDVDVAMYAGMWERGYRAGSKQAKICDQNSPE